MVEDGKREGVDRHVLEKGDVEVNVGKGKGVGRKLIRRRRNLLRRREEEEGNAGGEKKGEAEEGESREVGKRCWEC